MGTPAGQDEYLKNLCWESLLQARGTPWDVSSMISLGRFTFCILVFIQDIMLYTGCSLYTSSGLIVAAYLIASNRFQSTPCLAVIGHLVPTATHRPYSGSLETSPCFLAEMSTKHKVSRFPLCVHPRPSQTMLSYLSVEVSPGN